MDPSENPNEECDMSEEEPETLRSPKVWDKDESETLRQGGV